MKDPRVLLQYILECADLVAEYVNGLEWDEFSEDTLKQDAVFRRLEVIGQAVKDLPIELREQYPSVPWRRIAGMRDKLTHDYLGIDLEITWNAAIRDLPQFREQVAEILRNLPKSDFS